MRYRFLTILAAVVLLIGSISGISIAGGNPYDIELWVVPELTYSVMIDTPAGGIDFGGMELNEVKWTTGTVQMSTATIYNNGNASADWQIRGAPLTTWTLVGSTNTKNDVRPNQINLTAVLTPETTSAAVINDSAFSNSDIIDTTWRNMGDPTDYNRFAGGDETTGGKNNGNNVIANDRRIMWLRLKMPNETTVDTPQQFQINIRASPADTF